MKIKSIRIKSILSALAVAGLATASQSALADTITTTYAGSTNFGSGGVGYYTGYVVPNPNSDSNFVAVGIGGDSFASANHSYDFSAAGQFNVWCVDIYHWLSGGAVTYEVTTGAVLADKLAVLRPITPPTGAERVTALGKLANEVYSTLNTKSDSAAFQLAVWAITYGAYESGQYVINTTNSGFRVNSATATSAYGVLANQWLTGLNTAAVTGNYKLTYLNDDPNNITQDMIVFTPVPVPEPAALALLAIGLLGLGMIRMKLAPKLA